MSALEKGNWAVSFWLKFLLKYSLDIHGSSDDIKGSDSESESSAAKTSE
jgi:hypothetical protein